MSIVTSGLLALTLGQLIGGILGLVWQLVGAALLGVYAVACVLDWLEARRRRR